MEPASEATYLAGVSWSGHREDFGGGRIACCPSTSLLSPSSREKRRFEPSRFAGLLRANESCAHPELVSALRVIVDRIDASIPRTYAEPVAMFIAGGVAMNYYYGSRYTEEVDASFSNGCY